jgi:hypothetical protein
VSPKSTRDDPREPSARPSAVRTRSRVLGLTPGAEFHVEVWDELTKTGVVPFPEALTVAADITLEIARIVEVLVAQLDQDDGTLPERKRQMTEWRKKGTGTEGLN